MVIFKPKSSFGGFEKLALVLGSFFVKCYSCNKLMQASLESAQIKDRLLTFTRGQTQDALLQELKVDQVIHQQIVP